MTEKRKKIITQDGPSALQNVTQPKRKFSAQPLEPAKNFTIKNFFLYSNSYQLSKQQSEASIINHDVKVS